MSRNVIPATHPAQLYFRPWVRRGLATGVDWTNAGAVATIARVDHGGRRARFAPHQTARARARNRP